MLRLHSPFFMFNALRSLVFVLFMPALAFARPAQAAPIAKAAPDALTQEARQRWEEALRALDAEDFERARLAFKQAYALKPNEITLQNLGVVEILLKRYLEAARDLSHVLHDDVERTSAERTGLQAQLSEAEAQVGKISISAQPGDTEVVVDDESLGRTPAAVDWYVAPGPHTVVAHRVGFVSETQQVTVNAGERVELKFVLHEAAKSALKPGAPEPSAPPPTAVAPPPADHSARRTKTIVWVAGGTLTAALVGMSVVEAVRAKNANDEAKALRAQRSANCPENSPTPSCGELSRKLEDRNNEGFASRLALAGAGIAVAATVTTVWLLSLSRNPSSNAARVSVSVTPQLASVSFTTPLP